MPKSNPSQQPDASSVTNDDSKAEVTAGGGEKERRGSIPHTTTMEVAFSPYAKRSRRNWASASLPGVLFDMLTIKQTAHKGKRQSYASTPI